MRHGWIALAGSMLVVAGCGHEAIDFNNQIAAIHARLGTAVEEFGQAIHPAVQEGKPLTADEWRDTWVEVSVLSAMQPIMLESEQTVLRDLRPGVDGVLLEFGHHRGTFLPQVWEQLRAPEAFLMNLKRKAGLPPDFWEPGLKLSRYTVAKWREQDL